ncbi:cbb3-type cytochrome c oxidase subunit 3 [Sulfitobacter sp.]|uniref:cbb3-type cytochrome c oxidase subunit 3 n=1 Tax=Sulfitobacter sp. TaxID=1903071 RepID=UPI003561D195|tara:strand:+ start:3398 stop:3592 length:195 start_codon:yes stop_codon:yes gene_type:complete
MNTYSLLRELADSWVLLAMFIFFAGVILWAYRPGSGEVYKSVAHIPLGDDTKPKTIPAKGDDHV